MTLSIEYARSFVVTALRAAKWGSRNVGRVAHGGNEKTGPRTSGTSRPSPSSRASTRVVLFHRWSAFASGYLRNPRLSESVAEWNTSSPRCGNTPGTNEYVPDGETGVRERTCVSWVCGGYVGQEHRRTVQPDPDGVTVSATTARRRARPACRTRGHAARTRRSPTQSGDRQQPCDGAQRGGLASALRPEQGDTTQRPGPSAVRRLTRCPARSTRERGAGVRALLPGPAARGRPRGRFRRTGRGGRRAHGCTVAA
jgi:hypothetical protein